MSREENEAKLQELTAQLERLEQWFRVEVEDSDGNRQSRESIEGGNKEV